jgi:hypothetical protein
VGLGLLLALQVMVWFDLPKCTKGTSMPAVPTPIIEALGEVLDAKSAHDAAADALAKASAAETAAKNQLIAKRTALEAVEDRHLQPGAQP